MSLWGGCIRRMSDYCSRCEEFEYNFTSSSTIKGSISYGEMKTNVTIAYRLGEMATRDVNSKWKTQFDLNAVVPFEIMSLVSPLYPISRLFVKEDMGLNLDQCMGQHTNTDLQHTVITSSQRFANSFLELATLRMRMVRQLVNAITSSTMWLIIIYYYKFWMVLSGLYSITLNIL